MGADLTLNYKLPVKDMSKHTGGPNEPRAEWNSWKPGNFTHPYPIYPFIFRNENKAWKDRHFVGRLHIALFLFIFFMLHELKYCLIVSFYCVQN